MLCARNEMLSGIRGRAVTFTVFDYAADIEIECSPMTSPATVEGFIATGQVNPAAISGSRSGSEVFPSDGSRGLKRSSSFISCASEYGYGATAVSVGESDFVNRGQRVVQALSLYCPKGTRDSSPSNAQKMVDAMDRCLREESRLVYYSSPNKRTYSGSAAYSNSTISYDPSYLDRQPPYLRAYQLATLSPPIFWTCSNKSIRSKAKTAAIERKRRTSSSDSWPIVCAAKKISCKKTAEIRAIGLRNTVV